VSARLAEFERRLELLTHKTDGQMDRLDSPWFGVHAVLKRGIGFEREYLTWCEWMSERLGSALERGYKSESDTPPEL
jgi:hypothetical protein